VFDGLNFPGLNEPGQTTPESPQLRTATPTADGHKSHALQPSDTADMMARKGFMLPLRPIGGISEVSSVFNVSTTRFDAAGRKPSRVSTSTIPFDAAGGKGFRVSISLPSPCNSQRRTPRPSRPIR
jgi:hypothetical protein